MTPCDAYAKLSVFHYAAFYYMLAGQSLAVFWPLSTKDEGWVGAAAY